MAKSLNKFTEAPFAFTDLETTGDVFGIHEILEIGLVVVDQNTFEVINEMNVKVKPNHPEINKPAAMDRNGYTPELWESGSSLKDAMEEFALKSKGALFMAFNATFDWGFMNEAFRTTGVKDQMDYHRFDVMSMAYLKLRNAGIEKWRLSSIAKYFGIPEEPMPHRAINGAYSALEVYKKLIGI